MPQGNLTPESVKMRFQHLNTATFHPLVRVSIEACLDNFALEQPK